MAMELDLIDMSHHDDVIAEGMYMRQMEYLHYQMDLTQVNIALAGTELSPEVRAQFEQRKGEIEHQMGVVEGYYNGLKSQVRSPELHAAALQRNAEKRAAREAAALARG